MLIVFLLHAYQQSCPYNNPANGWTRVRHVPAGNTWHQATDRLAGTEVYGSSNDDTIAWSVDFESASAKYDQFLFATGDCVHWLIVNKNDVIGGTPYANQPRDIQSSSSSSTPYQARWYNRDGYLEDPWISVDDHADAISEGTIVYGENSFGLYTHASAILPLHGGADVYIRKAADIDVDGDGTFDNVDGCPGDPNKIAPGNCGCGVPDTDSDSDGTLNCFDNCPYDSDKTEPGICGCHVPENTADSDGDGTIDCFDECPNDFDKTERGVCGCGVPDSPENTADWDGDGKINCLDSCNMDPSLWRPGECCDPVYC